MLCAHPYSLSPPVPFGEFASQSTFIEHPLCVTRNCRELSPMTSSIFIFITTYDIFPWPFDKKTKSTELKFLSPLRSTS